ncbi:MAG: hypothetical protein EPO07_14595, partial [Verrucomicrobia bacterium]
MKVNAFALLVAFALFAASESSATVYRILTGDNTAINPDWSASENSRTFQTVISGSPSKPWISSTQHFSGAYSIGIQVPTDNSGEKERFEYTIAHASDPDGLHFDNARYSGFAFKLASPASSFGSSMLFWQAWQGSPWGPPASLKLTANSSSPYTIGLYIRNTTNGPDSAVSDTKLWSSQMIQPDTWYAVVVYLSPRYTNGNGNIKLWINGTQQVNWTGNIGYDPSLVTNAYDGLDIKNGIYQPDANNGHTMYFDQLLLASSYAEASTLPSYTNNPPTAVPGNASTRENALVDFNLWTVANDFETPSAKCLFSVSEATNGSVALLPDGHTARFTPATNFVGTASYTYTVTDMGEDPRTYLHYSFEPPDNTTDGIVTDDSGNGRDGTLLAIGSGAFAYSTNIFSPAFNSASLELTQSGTSGAACLSRLIPTQFNLSDSDWTFAGWFQRTATTDHDFLFYVGADNGFGGGGDELQLDCPNQSSTLRLQHYNTNNVLDVDFSSAATATAGQWHHAALVFQRTNTNTGLLRAYLDGAQFGPTTNVAWVLQQLQPVVFGGHNSTTSAIDRWFNGRLDDLVLFTNALSASEISSLATHTVGSFGGFHATNTVSIAVTAYARPTLSNLTLTNGSRSLLVSGDAGVGYTIQTSTNLTDWISLLTTNPVALPFRFVDATSNDSA